MTTKKQLKKFIDEQDAEIKRLKGILEMGTPLINTKPQRVFRFRVINKIPLWLISRRAEHLGDYFLGKTYERLLEEEKNKAKRELCNALYSRFDEFGVVEISEIPTAEQDGIVAYIDLIPKTNFMD